VQCTEEQGLSFRVVDFQTGKVRWSQDRFGGGSVTLAGNRLLIMPANRTPPRGTGRIECLPARAQEGARVT
jgi:hypothetical protein